MTSKLTSLEKECGNCIHLNINIDQAPGRKQGDCLKGQGIRYVTDYCYRWELKDGHVQIIGRGSDSSIEARNAVSRTASNNRPASLIEDDRREDKTPNFRDK